MDEQLTTKKPNTWSKTNPIRYKHSVCLSLVRYCLRNKIVTEQEILDTIKEYPNLKNKRKLKVMPDATKV